MPAVLTTSCPGTCCSDCLLPWYLLFWLPPALVPAVRGPAGVARRARQQPKVLNEYLKVIFEMFLLKVKSQVKVRSKVKTVTFCLISNSDKTNSRCKPKLCNNASQRTTKVPYDHRVYAKQRSRSTSGQISPNENAAWLSFETCLMGHLERRMRRCHLFLDFIRRRNKFRQVTLGQTTKLKISLKMHLSCPILSWFHRWRMLWRTARNFNSWCQLYFVLRPFCSPKWQWYVFFVLFYF